MSAVTSSGKSQGIVYAMVARDTTVLCQHSEGTGNMETVTRRILEKLPAQNEFKMSYAYEQYLFNIVKKDGITYVCLSGEAFGRRRPYAFLDEMATKFTAAHGSHMRTALAFAFQDSFGKTLRNRMDFYNNSPEADKILKVQSEINDVKNVVTQNLEKVLERGEKLEVLEDKTQNLSVQATKFKKQANTLRKAEWWKNMKLNLIILSVLILFILIIVAAVCLQNKDSC